MSAFIIDHQLIIRLSSFFGILLFMAIWEMIAPRRRLHTSKAFRWTNNLLLTTLNSIIARFLFPLSAAALAIVVEERGWGVMGYLRVSSFIAGLISIVFLDFIIYLQHFIFHKVTLFWYLHGMHHTDLDIDVTTGARFHPVEIVLSVLIKMGVILVIGVPAWSFIVFEVILNATSMFNHSNVFINTSIDKLLRIVLVTPDMHRVHHSVIIREHDSNFSFNFSWWDRFFGTYQSQPKEGHDNMVIGLANFRDLKGLSLPRLIALPFTSWRQF
jgi:sterol desaturase/sphingolipid hydroxylase (fatty acid hydroxylase superfamily)